MAREQGRRIYYYPPKDYGLPTRKTPELLPISIPEKYSEFLSSIDNGRKFISLLAGIYGFVRPTKKYAGVPTFSDPTNQMAVNLAEAGARFVKPQNAKEWLALYAPSIFEHCTPRNIIALSRYTHRAEVDSTDTSKTLDYLLRMFLKNVEPELKTILLDLINEALANDCTYYLAVYLIRDWRDWIDPKYIGLYREPAQT